jgi:hypothetical protein
VLVHCLAGVSRSASCVIAYCAYDDADACVRRILSSGVSQREGGWKLHVRLLVMRKNAWKLVPAIQFVRESEWPSLALLRAPISLARRCPSVLM